MIVFVRFSSLLFLFSLVRETGLFQIEWQFNVLRSKRIFDWSELQRTRSSMSQSQGTNWAQYAPLFFSSTESQLVTIKSQPRSPVSVLEGQNLTLEWTFIVARTFGRVQFGFSGAVVPRIEASPGSPSVIRGIFRGRAEASTTETNATITFTSLIRTDTASYVFAVTDDDDGVAQAPLQLIVLCEYIPKHPFLLFTTGSKLVF